MVKRYRESLRSAISIIFPDIPGLQSDLALQIVFKAINNSIEPDGFVQTLLIWGVYPQKIK